MTSHWMEWKKKKDWQLSFPVFVHPSASFLISFSRCCLKKETKKTKQQNQQQEKTAGPITPSVYSSDMISLPKWIVSE